LLAKPGKDGENHTKVSLMLQNINPDVNSGLYILSKRHLILYLAPILVVFSTCFQVARAGTPAQPFGEHQISLDVQEVAIMGQDRLIHPRRPRHESICANFDKW